MSLEVYNTGSSKVWIDDNQFIHCEYIKKSDVTIETAKEDIKNISELASERKIPLIVDIGNVKSITKEVREYFSGEEPAEVLSAVALIVKSSISKVMANFFLGRNKTSIPIKTFTSEDNASEWLKTIVRDLNEK